MVIGGHIIVLFLGSCVGQFLLVWNVQFQRVRPRWWEGTAAGGRQQEPDTDCSHLFCIQEAEKAKHHFKNKNFYCVFSFFFN